MNGSTQVLKQADGFEVRLHERGAAITGIRVPLHDGPVEAVLDYPDSASREQDPYYLGVTCGRYANRIDGAHFRLDNQDHALAANPGHGGHTLHGGPEGFSRRIWTPEKESVSTEISFRLHSPDGDQGFPGALEAKVRYRLLKGWVLVIDVTARSDAPTVINLANHAYFNLSDGSTTTDDHWVSVEADRYLPVRDDMIPTGILAQVAKTPFDLRRATRLGSRRRTSHPQLSIAGGFDHNFVLRGTPGTLRRAGHLLSPDTGLRLTVNTTLPGLQLYGGQHLAKPFQPGQGVCFEAQQFPDAPNQAAFPLTQLRPGQHWRQQTVYHFDRVV